MLYIIYSVVVVILIDYGDRHFDDAKLRPYEFSRRIARNYYQNECEIFMVYGMPEGVGKTAFVSHVQSDLAGYQLSKDKEALQWMWKDKPSIDTPVWEADWESIRQSIFYLPEDVVKKCKGLLVKDRREMCFHWDDAGTWLNAMEWHDPFIVAFMEYLSLARSNWAAVILSTPVSSWVLKKLRTAEGILQVPIIKLAGKAHIFRPRRATCYRIIKYPNRARPYWKTQFKDNFIAIMPDPFYAWYQPQRKRYGLLATLKMDKALKKRKTQGWDVSEDELVSAQVKEHISRANDEATDFKEVVEQKIQEAH